MRTDGMRTLVEDFDIVDFHTRIARWSVDLTPATAAGIRATTQASDSASTTREKTIDG